MALLNETQIKTIFEIDRTGELFTRLLGIFEFDMPNLILDLESNLKSAQFVNAKKISHSIKSSSLNMGAAELASIASNLEDSISQNNIHQDGLVIELRKCFEYSVTELRKYLDSCQS